MIAPAAGLAVLRRFDEADGGLRRHADVLVAGHAVVLAQGDRRQGVGVHLLRRAGGEVAIGLLMPQQPEQARGDRAIVRFSAGLVRFAVGEEGEQAHGGRGGVGVDVAGTGAGRVLAPLGVVFQAPTAVGRLMPSKPFDREADGSFRARDPAVNMRRAMSRTARTEGPAAGPRAALCHSARRSRHRSWPGERWAELPCFPAAASDADVVQPLAPAASISTGQVALRADGFDIVVRRLLRRRLILNDRRNFQVFDVRGRGLRLRGDRDKGVRRRANRLHSYIAQEQEGGKPQQVDRETGRVPDQFISHPVPEAIRPGAVDRLSEFLQRHRTACCLRHDAPPSFTAGQDVLAVRHCFAEAVLGGTNRHCFCEAVAHVGEKLRSPSAMTIVFGRGIIAGNNSGDFRDWLDAAVE